MSKLQVTWIGSDREEYENFYGNTAVYMVTEGVYYVEVWQSAKTHDEWDESVTLHFFDHEGIALDSMFMEMVCNYRGK